MQLFITALTFWAFALLIAFLNSSVLANKEIKVEDVKTADGRLYFLKKLGGAGCPYTASWLINVNLYRRVSWWIDITKMEAASFAVFDKARWKFQVSDPDAYFVHHMSMYEHLLHKKYGFEVAHNKTLLLSQAAMAGECDGLKISKSRHILSIIPFYGGLPPNVTKDLSVKSIGQGNSLVDASVKVLQAMAAVCSNLRYFGRVVIGVARTEDRLLMIQTLRNLSSTIRHHVNVIQLKMHKPSHLPFHLIAWGQHYVQHHNCQSFYDKSSISNLPPGSSSTDEKTSGSNANYGFTTFPIIVDKVPKDKEEYQICLPGAIAKYHGGPVQVIFALKDLDSHGHSSGSNGSNATSKNSTTSRSSHHKQQNQQPLRLVHYSECDQVVRFDSEETFIALSTSSNETAFFVGRRKEKDRESDPLDYMGGLNQWRECGVNGYILDWPKTSYVYAQQKQ